MDDNVKKDLHSAARCPFGLDLRQGQVHRARWEDTAAGFLGGIRAGATVRGRPSP